MTFLLVPVSDAAVAAINKVGIFEQCATAPVFNKTTGTTDDYLCTGVLRCASTKSGPTTASIPLNNPDIPQQACFPEKEFALCGAGGDCTKRTDGNIECVTVVNVTTPSKYGATCLNKTESPQDDVVKDLCQTSKDCNTGKQCVKIVAWETTGIDEWVGVKKCIDVQKLPAAVLEANKGSCGQNATCAATQSCVENTYEPSALKSYVCYAQQMVGGACTDIAGECTFGSKKGTCMNVYDNGTKQARCIDPSLLPNGPQSNSQQTCKADSDCKAEVGYTFCINNPATKQNNCFSQKTIFTDMSKLPQQLCNGAPCPCIFPDKTGCEPTGQESICAAYATKPGTAVCIKYASAGAALGTGAGAASTDHNAATQIPNVAAETYERFAPQLQIDIPNLNFTEKIVAQASNESGGSRTFFVPYLATYINAVYKYALGLGVLIAIVMIMFAGFRWMSSLGNAKAVSEAKSMIGNSVFGLGLLFGAYSILYVINPDLPQMKALRVVAPKQEVFFVPEIGNDEVTDGEPGEVFSPSSITPGKLPDFKQCDPQWRNVPYLGPGLNPLSCSNGVDTICKSGCAVTSLAAVMVFHGYSVTPADTAKYAAGVGAHTSCRGTAAGSMCSELSKKFPKLKCTPIGGRNVAGIAQKLQQNKPVIFSCHGCTGTTVNGNSKTYKAHYMVLTGVDASGKNFTVLDVGNKGADRNVKSINISEFEQGRIMNAFVVEPQS